MYVPSNRKDFFDIKFASVRTCVQPKSKLAEDHLIPYTKIIGLGTFKQVTCRLNSQISLAQYRITGSHIFTSNFSSTLHMLITYGILTTYARPTCTVQLLHYTLCSYCIVISISHYVLTLLLWSNCNILPSLTCHMRSSVFRSQHWKGFCSAKHRGGDQVWLPGARHGEHQCRRSLRSASVHGAGCAQDRAAWNCRWGVQADAW